ERAEIGEQREALIAVKMPERPGSFKQFCKALGRRMITEFNYRYADTQQAVVFAGVQIQPDVSARAELVDGLREQGYDVVDLSEDEMAKIHIRYMVGGHAPQVADELVYRFEFPERPGALMNFLTKLGARWNISMFHYRNHGAAYGRVLVGIQVPEQDKALVEGYLTEIGYNFWEETENPAYRLFLS
ncbi:MAG TPA: threonine ammonia-lyase, biosynthetic, partial [Motiliproteus sp.]